MRSGTSIRRGVAWLFVGNTGNQILTFLFGIVLARLLAPEVFGLLVAIHIYTGLAGFVSGGGMGQALVHAKEASKHDYDVVFTLQIMIGCLIYAVFFFGAPWLAAWYKTPLYTDLLRVSALSFILRPFFNLPSNLMYREMRFRELAMVNTSALLVGNSVSVTLAYLGFGVWGLIASGLAGTLVGIAILFSIAGWRPRLSWEWWRGRDLARYGMLVSIGDFIVYLRNQASNFVLSRTLGPHALGLFNKAYSLTVVPHAVTGSVYQVTFRSLAKERGNLDISQYIYLRSVTLVSLYTWPAFLGLGWLAHPLLHVIYGDKWIDAAPPMTWFAVVGPFIMLEMLAGCVLAARSWLNREIPVQVCQLIVVLLGAVAGLPYGLLGVAVGASLSNIYGALHMSWLASRCLSIPARRIASAMSVPFLLNLAVLLLWYAIDRLFTPRDAYGDAIYLAIMLGSGGLLYLGLFLLAPIPSIASEKKRWLDLLKKGMRWVGKP